MRTGAPAGPGVSPIKGFMIFVWPQEQDKVLDLEYGILLMTYVDEKSTRT